MDDFVVKPVVEDTIVLVLKKWLFLETDFITVLAFAGDTELLHFDLNILKDLIGDDPVVIAEILSLTKSQLSRSKEIIEQAIEQQQSAVIQAEGNKLYGTSVSAGLPKLAITARAVEMSAETDQDAAAVLYKDLLDEIKLCMELI